MWRWSSIEACAALNPRVFSTYVEVILTMTPIQTHKQCFLHVCGGDPHAGKIYKNVASFSPRMWRWSYVACFLFLVIVVFSTYVEVILHKKRLDMLKIRFLHVCGGDPMFMQSMVALWLFSPRMWRWSYWLVDLDRANPVFSTYVGVILTITLVHDLKLYFLHKSGAKLTQWKKNHKQKSYNRGLFLFD